ncbi:MAG: hypothetical protein OTJ97_10145, partial [SAR202 cluster bacterium]|nr:hypothetical protein [SAR202 cluster bacterium]
EIKIEFQTPSMRTITHLCVSSCQKTRGSRVWGFPAASLLELCPDCGGRLRWIAALTDPASVRRYLVRYHGILAPNARDRSQVVPDPPSLPVSPSPGDSLAPSIRPHRLTWAALLAHVFALDVTVSEGACA